MIVMCNKAINQQCKVDGCSHAKPHNYTHVLCGSQGCMLSKDCCCVEIDVKVNVDKTVLMNLTYTQTLSDECIKPLKCAWCGYQFLIGEMMHEIPLHGIYNLFCGRCAKTIRTLDD